MSVIDFQKTLSLTGTLGIHPLEASALQAAAPVVLALAECDEELRAEAITLFKQLAGGELDPEQRYATTVLLEEILFPDYHRNSLPGLDSVEAEELASKTDPGAKSMLQQMDQEEAHFADRLREIMQQRGMTQAQLAEKLGIGQPAICMMLQRQCRPQRRTVVRLAEALEVAPTDLWPGFEVRDAAKEQPAADLIDTRISDEACPWPDVS
jgi:transcriptional regulator with XRE-family HTH domain